MFNQATPSSVKGTMAVFESPYGIAKSPFRNCRPRPEGWMVLLQGNEEHIMHFEEHDHISNISFVGDIDDFEQDEWITIRHDFPERIDRANLNGEDVDGNFIGGEFLNETFWPNDLDLDSYTYHVDKEEAPFSVRYTFNGNNNTEFPQLDTDFGAAYTYGQNYQIAPDFYKCFFKDCIVPPPAPPTPAPNQIQCSFKDCSGLWNVNGTLEWENLVVDKVQHMVIDSDTVEEFDGHIKLSSVFIDGTLEVSAAALDMREELVIEADHMIINTPTNSSFDLLEDNRRRRRDTMYLNKGTLIIGTASNPIPCGKKVTLKINGDEESISFGALPDSIPIGAKAIGGIGSIEMHGCQRSRVWSTLKNTINAGDTQIQLTDEDIMDWMAGDEIVIATTDHEHRHTEYFKILEIANGTITLDKEVEWRHLGYEETKTVQLGREYHQGAEVGLLSRNIVLDGTEGADGKFGARVLITQYTTEIDGHDYVRLGHGQFENVEFKGFGQYGYDSYVDLRSQILFYQIDGAAGPHGEASYVRNCAFHSGYHTAVAAMFDADNIEITSNVIFGLVGSAIRTDSLGVKIVGNIIGNVFQPQLVDNYFASTQNANFADDNMPAGIDTEFSMGNLVADNRVAGVDGSCFSGNGEECDHSESCAPQSTSPHQDKNNVGHSCLRGFYIFRVGRVCAKIRGYTLFKNAQFGVMFVAAQQVQSVIIEDTIIADSRVGFSGFMIGPDARVHLAQDKSITLKNSAVIGRGRTTFDCDYDNDLMLEYFAKPSVNRQHPTAFNQEDDKKGLKPQHPDTAAIIFPEFLSKDIDFPASNYFIHKSDAAMYGQTCVINTQFSEFNGRCGGKDFIFTTHTLNWDHTYRLSFLTGNSCINCNKNTIAKFHRPIDKLVNPADCVDLHCDGKKSGVVFDKEGTILGAPGHLTAEREYEWDGVNRGGVTYKSTRDGLGDYRIPTVSI